jgi:hypothetical protein
MAIPNDLLAKLGPRQRQVYDWFAALEPEKRCERGMAAKAARHLGCSYGNVTTFMDGIRKHLGGYAEDVLPPKAARKISVEAAKSVRGPKPRRFRNREALELAAEKEILEFESSIGQYDRVAPHVRAARTQEMLALTGWNALRVLASMTDRDIAKASLKDKAIAFGILTEKRQLLAGEPTQIVSFEERRKIPEMLLALSAELQRRGRTIDVTPTHSGVEIANP